MGMYDDVEYECVCPVCRRKVEGFQSKDGECILDYINPREVYNFYSSCDTCGCWVEFDKLYEGKWHRSVRDKNHKLIEKYNKTVRIK